MADRTGSKRRLRALGAAALLVALVELVLCFAGPIAFTRKPSVMLFPLFQFGLDERDAARVCGWIEREIALTGSYSIMNRRLLEDRGHPLDETISYDKAVEVAKELGLERFVLAVVFASEGGAVEASIAVRSTLDGEAVRSCRCRAASVDALVSGGASCDDPAGLAASLAVETRGIGLTDFLVLAVLAAQLALGALALAGREPGALAEVVWAPALVLFLFAYIYARGANMDYMQRFAAMKGQIQLARSTALEQAYALLRFAPLLLVDGALVARRALRALRGLPRDAGWVARVVSPWALGWTILSAALFALSFPSFASIEGWGPLAWVSLVPLFLALRSAPLARGFFCAVVFGALQALLVNFWHGTYSYVTLHLVTIGFVVEYALFAPLLARAAKGRWSFVALAAAWTVFDALRSSGLLAYPWGLIGTTQYRFLPLIQIASLTGQWGVGFVVVLANGAIAQAAAARGSSRLAPLAAAATALLACTVAGALMLRATDAAAARAADAATIVAVQPNTDPRKHAYDENQGALASLTDRALASLRRRPDLVVWPEGAVPFDIRSWSDPRNAGYGWGPTVTGFLDYQRERGVWLLTGTFDYPPGTEAHFNSSTIIDPRGGIAPCYHKMRLVPFTEHFPLDKKRFAGLYDFFQKLDISDWSMGEERVVFAQEKMRVVTMICFEDVFADHVRRFVLRDVDVIFNIGNDYWSLSPVEGRQHGILALFRAVENRRPVVRVTCSGYTVSIDAAGRIRPGAPEPYTAAAMITRVPLAAKRLTPYTRWGDWFPAACACALLAAWAAGAVRRAASKASRWRRARADAMMDTALAWPGRPGGGDGAHLS